MDHHLQLSCREIGAVCVLVILLSTVGGCQGGSGGAPGDVDSDSQRWNSPRTVDLQAQDSWIWISSLYEFPRDQRIPELRQRLQQLELTYEILNNSRGALLVLVDQRVQFESFHPQHPDLIEKEFRARRLGWSWSSLNPTPMAGGETRVKVALPSGREEQPLATAVKDLLSRHIGDGAEVEQTVNDENYVAFMIRGARGIVLKEQQFWERLEIRVVRIRSGREPEFLITIDGWYAPGRGDNPPNDANYRHMDTDYLKDLLAFAGRLGVEFERLLPTTVPAINP